ncbi:uncharacterized protein [Amphiura filiformis]|uniref:uncharacterized protein n=1 Tax=Amphiura filiformis TaxID=82378 RepID=UPI003B22698C
MFVQLQLLVQEMKDGFVLAMQELGRIQDWDKNLSDRVETSERNNQRMINDLTQSVQQLKTDLSSALVEVRKNSEMTETLSEQVQEIHNDRKQLLEEIKQQNTMQIRDRSKHKPSAVDSDNNNSDSGKPHSNGDSCKSEWEGTRGKRVSPMLHPFMDSLPDTITGTMSPPCDTDSDSSATKAANHMLRMGNRTLREKYKNHQQGQDATASGDSDDLHDILAQLPDGKEGGTLTKKDFEGASPNDV